MLIGGVSGSGRTVVGYKRNEGLQIRKSKKKKKREIMAAMKRAYLVTAICDEKLRAGNQDRMCTLGEKGWDRAHMRVWG